MNINDFIWHAKRGHGECILELEKSHNLNAYKNIVKKIVLNNYAFLKYDEFRSAYACELASFYNDDIYFIELILKKINRTSIEEFHTFEYLLNNLYFLLKGKKISYDIKIEKLLIKNMNKEKYLIDECYSIGSLISLIYDLKMNINVKKILENHYQTYQNSNLNISFIKYNYDIDYQVNNIRNKKEDLEYSLELLVKCIYDNDTFNNNILFLEGNIIREHVLHLYKMFEQEEYESFVKINILRVIFYSGLYNARDLKKLVSFIDISNKEQKKFLYLILSDIKSKKILKMLNDKKNDASLLIRVALKNYTSSLYLFVHKKINILKINYSNSNEWFEVENDLIEYFNKKKVDARLLEDLKMFLHEGLSSNSRYEIVKILYKYNKLSKEEIKYLKKDANVEIGEFLKKTS